VDNIRHVYFPFDPAITSEIPKALVFSLSLSLSLSPSFGDSILFNLPLTISRDNLSRDENIHRFRGGSISASEATIGCNLSTGASHQRES